MNLQVTFDIVDNEAALFENKVLNSFPTHSASIVEYARTTPPATSTEEAKRHSLLRRIQFLDTAQCAR